MGRQSTLDRCTSLIRAHPILVGVASCTVALALVKVFLSLQLKARVPPTEENVLHSYPQQQHPPLRTVKSAVALLTSLEDGSGDGEGHTEALLGEIVASQSRLSLVDLAADDAALPASPRAREEAGEEGALGLSLEEGGSPLRSDAAGRPLEDWRLLSELAQIQRLGETLSTDHKVHLRSLMTERTLREGEVLMELGADASDGLYLVTAGSFCVKASKGASLGEAPLCVFEKGTSLGENALIAGVIPGVSQAPSSSGASSPRPRTLQQWMPSFLATRPCTVVAQEASRVLCLSAASFSKFSARYPEAAATIIMESTCRQWRVAHTLLVQYFLLEEAWQASLEPPGAFPAFSFAPGEDGQWGVCASPSTSAAARGGGAGAAAAAVPAFPPPISLPVHDLEAAADSVLTYLPGDTVYAAGEPCSAIFCVLEGWAATLLSDAGRHSSSDGSGLEHAQGFPLASLRRVGVPAPLRDEGGGASAGAGVVAGAGTSSTCRRPSFLRLLGRGCLSAGPACLNSLAHRETLIAVGSTPLRLAVFKRSSFSALAKNKSPWGGLGGLGGAGSAGGVSTPSSPHSTMRPSLQPAASTAIPRTALQLFVALAAARSMVALPRMLLSLGMRRIWKACGEAIFEEGQGSNGMYFIVSGRVRCETRPPSRPASLPHFAPLKSQGGGSARRSSLEDAQQGQGPSHALNVDISAGGTVGELSVLSKEMRRSSTAVAARDCELVHISAPSFASLVSRHASVYEHFTASLARRVTDTTQALMAGGWGASSGAPGFLGVEKAVGIPFSLPAPPLPVLSFGGSTRAEGRRGGGGSGSAGSCGAGGLVRASSPISDAGASGLMPSSPTSLPRCARFHPPQPPASVREAWAAVSPHLIPLHPCAPTFSTLTLVPCGASGLAPGAILNLAQRLAAALAVTECGVVTLARRVNMEAQLGENAASILNLQYGRGRASAWLGGIEENSVFTVLVVEGEGSVEDTLWGRLCVQHSDVVLLVGAGGGSPELGQLEEKLQLGQTLARVDLCLLQPAGVPPKATRAWFNSGAGTHPAAAAAPARASQGGGASAAPLLRPWRRQITQHHHVRVEPSSACTLSAQGLGDVARLSRFLTGRAVGVVLGGGGSRGLAHLGLIRELVQRGVPIDVIGGASQGSFMAAAWATTENLAEMEAKVGVLARGVGSTFNIVTALTLPLVSWTSGAHVDDLVRSTLGNTQIEDLPGPRFFCVSLNATDGALAVHAVGPLWRYVRASMGVLKLLPPVFDKETKRLLCDGGYVSNLPVAVLHALLPGTCGLTFACDVENKESTANWMDISELDYGRGDSVELSGWWVAWRWMLASVGLGAPMRIPWTDELFLQVSYMMHYSDLRTLLSEEGYDGAMKEAVDREDVEPSAEAPPPTAGGRPHLCYIRPKVGKYSLLQYDAIQEIVQVGHTASKAQLDKWERRWRP